MQIDSSKSLEEQIISILKGFSGQPEIKPDQWISRDIGIYGGDGVEILYELEEKFNVDLNPLIDANTTFLPPTWFDRLRGKKNGPRVADVTVRQLVDYIAHKNLQRSSDGTDV